MYKITPEEYKVFAKYILDISGIMLGVGKEYLVETRLNPILMELKCKSFAELYHRVRTDQTRDH